MELIPEGLDLTSDDRGRLVIRRRWFNLSVIPLTFFCIAWDAFLIFWYTAAAAMEETPWIMVVFPVAHVAVGVGLTYYCIAMYVNKTDLTLSADGMEVHTYPIKWLGDQFVPLSGCAGVLVREETDSYKNSTYYVKYADSQGREKKLVNGMKAREQANFIRDKIAETLGVPKLNELKGND